MSISRHTDDESRRVNDVANVCDSNRPNSTREHSRTGEVQQLADIQRETGGYREKHGKKNGRKTETSGGDLTLVTSGLSSQIMPTRDLIHSSANKTSAVKEIHGVLRVPEGIRKSQSPKRDAVSASVNYERKGTGESMSEVTAYETDLSNLVSRWSGDASKFRRITEICAQLQQLWKDILKNKVDLGDCTRIWQNCHYVVTEGTRRRLARKSFKGNLKEEFLSFLESSIQYYTGLIELLDGASEGQSKRKEKINVLLCHHFNIYIGDLYRYQEHLAPKPDWAKPRSHYLRAKELAPKNGKPYNQLAVIAIHAHRRLDAVYYYIRSLTASNPFLSAKENLAVLFDETSKKAEMEEEKLKMDEERRRKRSEHKQKRKDKQTNDISKEVWVLPWQVDRLEDVLMSSSRQPVNNTHSPPSPQREAVSSEQPSSELMKNLVASMLIVHGKLFTKIGLERISNAIEKCVVTWKQVLHHRLSTQDTSRFMKMLVLCFFSMHNAAEREQASRPACLYYCGLAGSFVLQFLHEIIQVCNSALSAFDQKGGESTANQKETSPLGSNEELKSLLDHLGCYLPLIKIWFDWLCCQLRLWYDSSQQINDTTQQEFWMASECLLNHLAELETCLCLHSATATVASVHLWEDKSLAGFMPLKALAYSSEGVNHKDLFADGVHRIMTILRTCERLFAKPESSGDGVWILPLLFDGKKFVYQSHMPTSSSPEANSSTTVVDAPSSLEEHSTSDSDSVIVEDDSSEDEAPLPAVPLQSPLLGQETSLSDIEKLRIEKERLTRKLQTQQQTQQDIENVLEARSKQEVHHQRVVVPKYVVPDTNCFIYDLVSIQHIIASGHFTVVIPLTVVMELEGLMKGSSVRTDTPVEGAQKAVEYLKKCFDVKERCVKLLTTKGNFLSTMSIRSELTGIQISNDDYILLSSVNLRSKVDSSGASKTVENCYTVVLLTDDRNLRVKAHAQDFPVKSLSEFMTWCSL